MAVALSDVHGVIIFSLNIIHVHCVPKRVPEISDRNLKKD